MLKKYVRREEAANVAVGGSKCVQSVGDFVPWSEISPLLEEADMSVPKVPSISFGDFHAVESVRLESFKIMQRMFQFLLFLSQC